MHWLIQKHQKHFELLLWTENTETLSVCSSTAFCLSSFKFPSFQTDSLDVLFLGMEKNYQYLSWTFKPTMFSWAHSRKNKLPLFGKRL